MARKNILLEEIFLIKEINTDFFSKVPRIKAVSEYHNTELSLDVNVDIYPMKVNTSYSIALATALTDDGMTTTGIYSQEEFEQPSLMDKYEYVMYGKVFKIEEKSGKNLVISASFGGLLMMLKGEISILGNIPYDSRVYILLKQT